MDKKERLRLRNNFRLFQRRIRDVQIYVERDSPELLAYFMTDFTRLIYRLLDKQDHGYYFD
jgi:hypothetical protein